MNKTYGMTLPSVRPSGVGGGPLYDDLLALGRATDVLVHNITGVTGSGTVGDPWVGWDATITATGANTTYNFVNGHYSYSTTLAPGSAGKSTGAGNQVSLIGLGDAVYLHYTGGGIAINLDAYTGLGVQTRFYRMKLKNLLIEGNGTMVEGVRVSNVFECEIDNVTPYNFENSGSLSYGFHFLFCLCSYMKRLVCSNVTGLSGNMPAYGIFTGDRNYTKVVLSSIGNTTITAGTNVVTRSTGSFITDGLLVNNSVTLAGFLNAANNGTFNVLVVAAGSITISPGNRTIVTEGSSGTPTITPVSSTNVALSTTGSVGATSGTNVFTRASGSFITDGVLPGQYLKTTGFLNAVNNGSFLISAVAATTVTVTGVTLVTEGASGTPSINTWDVQNPPGCFGVAFDACNMEGCRKGAIWMQNGLGNTFTSGAGTVTSTGSTFYEWRLEKDCHEITFVSVDFEGVNGILIDGTDITIIGCTGSTNPVTFGALSKGCQMIGGSAGGVGAGKVFTNNGTYNSVLKVVGIVMATDIAGTGPYGIYQDLYDTSYTLKTFGATFSKLQITDATQTVNAFDIFADTTGVAGAGAGGYYQLRCNRTSHSHTWQMGINIGNFSGWLLNHVETAQTPIAVSEADGVIIGIAAGTVGFFGGAGTTKAASGENLTNNVTAGGTTGTIADFTSLTVYSTDAAAIRNDIYQLARKLKQVNDALRAYGILT